MLTERVGERHLGYLETMEIPYIFAGETELDMEFALWKPKNIFGINRLLLESGSILDGAFTQTDAIDELSLVVCPMVADTDSKPLFMQSRLTAYRLADVKHYDGDILWLNYKRQES